MKRKTYTITAVLDIAGDVLEYHLTRYGKRIASLTVQGFDSVMPVWKLRRQAEKLGATHIRLPLSGTIEKV